MTAPLRLTPELPPRLPTPPIIADLSDNGLSPDANDKKISVVGDLYDQYAARRSPPARQSPEQSPDRRRPSPQPKGQDTPSPEFSGRAPPPPPAKGPTQIGPLGRNKSFGQPGPDRSPADNKKIRRANTVASKPTPRRAYEEEDGYGSAEHEESPRAASASLQRIRVKLHYKDDVRGMVSCLAQDMWTLFFLFEIPRHRQSISSAMTHETFVAKVQAKFGVSRVGLKYKDEDEALVTILDESDWESGKLYSLSRQGHVLQPMLTHSIRHSCRRFARVRKGSSGRQA
jgi:hypothetical protein